MFESAFEGCATCVCVCSTGQGFPEKRCKRYWFAISLSGLGHLDSLSRTRTAGVSSEGSLIAKLYE